MRVTEYEMIIYETIQFLQEGSNRILSKVQNPSGLVLMWIVVKNTQYISITYFIEYFMQDNSKYPRIKKIHQILEKITRIDQKVKIHCVLLSHELLSTKIQFTYFIYYLFQDNLKNPKMMKIQQVIKRYMQNNFYYLI